MVWNEGENDMFLKYFTAVWLLIHVNRDIIRARVGQTFPKVSVFD